MIKAVIFDMDGVIVDSEPINARINHLTLKSLGREASEGYFYQFVGSNLRKLVERVNQEFALSVTPDEWYALAKRFKQEIVNVEGYPAIPHVKDAVRSLSEGGFSLAVASNSPFEEISTIIDYFGMTKYFRSLVSGLDVPKPKPSPDIYYKACGELGVAPSECLVFEDSHYGCLAATRAGMTCVGYANPHSGDQDLGAAILRIDSFKIVDASFVTDIGPHLCEPTHS